MYLGRGHAHGGGHTGCVGDRVCIPCNLRQKFRQRSSSAGRTCVIYDTLRTATLLQPGHSDTYIDTPQLLCDCAKMSAMSSRLGLSNVLWRGPDVSLASAVAAASARLDRLIHSLPSVLGRQLEFNHSSTSQTPPHNHQPSASTAALPSSSLLASRANSHSLASCSHSSGPAPYSAFSGLRQLHRRTRSYDLPPEVAATVTAAQSLKVKVPEPKLPPPVPGPRQPESVRVGCIAVKAGMTQEWDEWGVSIPLTVLWIDDCQVRCPCWLDHLKSHPPLSASSQSNLVQFRYDCLP